MTTGSEQWSLQCSQDPEDWLDRFEQEWKTGRAPDVNQYLQMRHPCAQYQSDLIQMDLEYRWRQYPRLAAQDARDEYGFPLLPTLDDYASLQEINREELLTPSMIAEEYRVRARWGDQPNRHSFVLRFPENPDQLRTALIAVEVELEVERETIEERPVDQLSTANFGQSSSSTIEMEVPLRPLPDQLDRYQLIKLIGRGGFGEVWRAHDPKLQRDVAIKIPRTDREFPAEALDLFLAEGQKLARLGTVPGIVTVYDAGTCAGHHYIVSELIEGESLEIRLRRNALAQPEAVEIVSAVAETLHRAHLKNLIHRDIKPGNILLRTDGTPVLADFGLAVTEWDQLREPRGFIGTLPYAPPEQILEQGHIANPQADIYSLGVVLYQLLTNRLPFLAETAEDYHEQILNRPPRSLRTINESIPEELESICLRCLEKRPEARALTAKDLAVSLRKALTPPSRRLRTIVASLFILLTCFAVAVPLWFNKDLENKPAGTGKPPRQKHVNLLMKAPEPVVWNAAEETNFYSYSEEKQSFFAHVKTEGVFSVGERKSNHFIYRVRLLVGNWESRFGIVWGIGKKPQPNAPALNRAHAILIETKGRRLQMRIVRLTFQNTGTSISEISIMSHIPHVPTPGKPADLEIEVKKGELLGLTVQGNKVPLNAPIPVFQEGELGFLVSKGNTHVIEAWFQDKENANE